MNGLHHVTAICGNAGRNLDFYTRTLGLRLIKKTVNFDDPGTYHLYFGDEAGRPGTILTFFPWKQAAAGRAGGGQVMEMAFRVPAASIGYWVHRFVERGVAHEAVGKRFGETVLPFTDPDGMRLALVASGDGRKPAGKAIGPVEPEHAIRGFRGVTLLLKEAGPTAAILSEVLGFCETAREGTVRRLTADGDGSIVVDVREGGGFLAGRMGRGSVHHIAFRAPDDAAQAALGAKLLADFGIRTTEQKDRKYFRSIYFREPGGVLFEIATDDPGFAVDELFERLGEGLMLPSFLEPRRREIEAILPPLERAA